MEMYGGKFEIKEINFKPRIKIERVLPTFFWWVKYVVLQWRMDVEKDEEAEPQGGWEWVKTQEEKIKKEREKVCWFSCTA